MRQKPTLVTAMTAVAAPIRHSRAARRARQLTATGLAIVFALVGFGCSDPAGSTSADGDVTLVDATDVQAIDGAVKSDTPPPLPDLPIVDECMTHEECNDGLFCNGEETCNPTAIGAGQNGCLPGEAPVMTDDDPRDCEVPTACDEETDSFPTRTLEPGDSCDDAIACTSDDVCTDDGVCTGVKRDDLCSDGLYCDGVETCNSDIGCVPGIAPVGSDPSAGDCLVPGPCEEATNSFPLIPAPLETPCDDAVSCTKNDGCTSGGTCAGTTTDAACSDGVFCNGEERCTETGCVAGSSAPPDDPTPNDCETFGTCDEETDSWTVVPRAASSPCDDGVECTTSDTCQDAQGTLTCTGDADATLCDDGAFCNGPEQCTPKGCIAGTPPETPNDDSPNDCTSFGPCDDATGAFTVVKKPVGSQCDDGASCTSDDLCDDGGSCGGTPDHAACDDGEFCNGVEVCSPAGCGAGTPPPPPEDTDPNDCIGPGTCNEQTDSYPMVPQAGTPCSDGAACTSDDTCDVQGVCAGTPHHDECDDGAFCNGAEQCTPSGCTAGLAPMAPADENTSDCTVPGPCDEATDTFPAVSAAAGASCDDGVACTAGDSCGGSGCAGTPNDAACADGDACNGAETCAATGCLAGTPLTAPVDPDPNDCRVPGTCDPATGEFPVVDAALDATCDDDVDCTTDDRCQASDGGAMACRGALDDTRCDDGGFCNGEETCTPSGCASGTPPTAPNDENTVDCMEVDPVCDPVANTFVLKPLPAGTSCLDQDGCTTVTACNDDGACVGPVDDSICDDGNPCNGVESCVQSECVGGVPTLPVDPNPNDCVVPNVCDPQTGVFTLGPAPVDTPCDDGLTCTTNDRCDDAGGCTVNTRSDAACADGQYCNGDEICDGTLGCQPGAPRAPPVDPNPGDCTGPLACDEATDSFPIGALGDGAACDDGVTCTANDVCTAGACGGTPTSVLCDDGVFCNGSETCVGDGCIPGTPPTAPPDPDPSDCIVAGACDEASKSFQLVPAAALAPCDDGVECTVSDHCDAAGTCQGTTDDALCMDGLVCDGNETCSLAGCLPGQPLEPGASGAPPECMRLADECSEEFGGFPFVPDVGATCDDGVSCTEGDLCDGAGLCSGMPNSMICDDGDRCNGDEICDTAGCMPGTPVPPPIDPNPTDCIILDVCDPAAGEYGFTQANDGAPCLDFEGAQGVCQGGGCTAGP
ncbi:MAG: hypothetical protein IV100_26635 [Myxococcales bacterium]|nr:hypothetical protein [Myxococcales bacterium]